MPSEFTDPYINPDTGVLRNLLGARTHEELANAEGEFVCTRANELLAGKTPRPTGSLADLCVIHKTLFQDVFDWAGTVRTVELRKNTEGAEFFLPVRDIARGAIWAQSELEADEMFVSVDSEHFARRLAYHYDNYIHPFREGNGRTQRLFWSLICHNAGFDLDWRQVSGSENDEASRLAAEDRDSSGLIAIFERVTRPCDPNSPIIEDSTGGTHLP